MTQNRVYENTIPTVPVRPSQRQFMRIPRRRFLIMSAMGILGMLGVGAFFTVQRWRYIVVHHSAGNFGNVDFLKRVHRQRQPHDPIDSMAYHFVVGNGNGLEMGEIKAGERWAKSLWGAHVSARNSSYNFQGIGICLVGNYHTQSLPAKQYDALVELVRSLMAHHHISSAKVFTHSRLNGERTVCPGRHFPYRRFHMDIA